MINKCKVHRFHCWNIFFQLCCVKKSIGFAFAKMVRFLAEFLQRISLLTNLIEVINSLLSKVLSLTVCLHYFTDIYVLMGSG